MSEDQRKEILTRLEKVFRTYNRAGPAGKDRRTHDFAFHMTDWHKDLLRLASLYRDPAAHDQQEWNQVVFGFLAHAVAHLMAAAALNDILLDPFDVAKKAKGLPPSRKRKPAQAVAA